MNRPIKQFNKGIQTTLQLNDLGELSASMEHYKGLLEEFKVFFRDRKNDEKFKDALAFMTIYQYVESELAEKEQKAKS